MLIPWSKNNVEGIDNFFDMMTHATNRYREEGAAMLYGFPNDNSYPILKYIGLMEDIGKLDTYCLPYRIGGSKISFIFEFILDIVLSILGRIF